MPTTSTTRTTDRGPRTTPPSSSTLEAPEADAAEQHAELAASSATTRSTGRRPRDEADRGGPAEQARVVALDEDDYR